MSFDHGFKLNETINNSQLSKIFKCGTQGGMRRSLRTNTLVLISDTTKSVYHDRWIDDVLHYTGMGLQGDQDLNFAQNKTLAQSKTNGVGVYLFEVQKRGHYIFKGKVELAGSPYQEEQQDRNGAMRKVWNFPLKVIDESDENLDQELIEDVSEILSSPGLSETEKQRLAASRLGQGEFRESLIKYWKGCSVTKCRNKSILRASHIKPWRVCDNTERLDSYNGFVLIPNLDIAFDKGLITFDRDGSILISSKPNKTDKSILGISETMCIDVNENHQKYLEFHRENIFRK